MNVHHVPLRQSVEGIRLEKELEEAVPTRGKEARERYERSRRQIDGNSNPHYRSFD